MWRTAAAACLPDEVASFLLYVKALDYQQKPDYQHLRRMLSSGGAAGRLDFLLTRGGAGEGTAYIQDNSTSSREVRVRGERRGDGVGGGVRGSLNSWSTCTTFDQRCFQTLN